MSVRYDNTQVMRATWLVFIVVPTNCGKTYVVIHIINTDIERNHTNFEALTRNVSALPKVSLIEASERWLSDCDSNHLHYKAWKGLENMEMSLYDRN